MRPSLALLSFSAVFALACSSNPVRPLPAEPHEEGVDAGASNTAIDLRVEPFPDFYFQVRAQAAGIVEEDETLAPIVAAWMPVQEVIGDFGGFWRFDLAGILSDSPAAFGEWFADVPETVQSRRGETIPVRGPGRAMAGAMDGPWRAFVEEGWNERAARLEGTVERLERDFLPRHRAALQHMLRSLNIDDPEIEVPMWLVHETHPPGASTYRSRGGPLVVLSINDLLEGNESDLHETLLHEACHVLDDASKNEDDAFTLLRAMLESRGFERRDVHDITHLVMFVQAEETMRRLYDPEHVAYGDTVRGEIRPLYERSGKQAVVVRARWGAYLDGEASLEATLEAIVDELADGAAPGSM